MTEPMSDERLAELRREAAVEPDDVMLEALAEIDRLRAEVAALRAELARMQRLDACRCVDGHEPGCHKAAL